MPEHQSDEGTAGDQGDTRPLPEFAADPNTEWGRIVRAGLAYLAHIAGVPQQQETDQAPQP